MVKWISQLVLVILMSISETVHAAPAAQGWTELQMRTAVTEFKRKLELEAWQDRIYLEEVIPQFRKFILSEGGATTSRSGMLSPPVDAPKIKGYLNYYESPGAFQPPKIVLFLQGDPSCVKCKASDHVIRVLTHARMERRGYNPIALLPADVLAKVGGDGSSLFPVPEVKPEMMDDEVDSESRDPAAAASVSSTETTRNILGQITRMMTEKEAKAFLWIRWWGLPKSEGVAPSYAIELIYQSPDGRRVQKEKTLTEEDRFESAEADLLNDLYIELGSKRVPAGQKAAAYPEVLVKVSRISEFAQLTRCKSLISSSVAELVNIQERKIARGEHTLAVQANEPKEQIIAQLETVKQRLTAGSEAGANALELTIVEGGP